MPGQHTLFVRYRLGGVTAEAVGLAIELDDCLALGAIESAITEDQLAFGSSLEPDLAKLRSSKIPTHIEHISKVRPESQYDVERNGVRVVIEEA